MTAAFFAKEIWVDHMDAMFAVPPHKQLLAPTFGGQHLVILISFGGEG